MQSERIKAGFRTQKELAVATNMKVDIIAAYENGKAVPNPQILVKIERALRRSNPEFEMGCLTKARKKKPRT